MQLEKVKANETLKEFLKKTKNRNTPERFEVLNYALDYEGHFTADELFITMKNGGSFISRATVYNTLELLTQAGLLTLRSFGDKLKHYESNLRKQVHDHLICMDCGHIIEFVRPEIAAIAHSVCNERGFQPDAHSFNVYAHCIRKGECPVKNARNLDGG